MLVIGRSENEDIVIQHAGETLVLTHCGYAKGLAKFGFEGPLSFVIRRAEIQNAIDERGEYDRNEVRGEEP